MAGVRERRVGCLQAEEGVAASGEGAAAHLAAPCEALDEPRPAHPSALHSRSMEPSTSSLSVSSAAEMPRLMALPPSKKTLTVLPGEEWGWGMARSWNESASRVKVKVNP